MVKIKIIDKDLPSVDYQSKGAAGIDLYSRVDAIIPKGEMRLIPLNVIVQTEEGCMTMLVPRSSLYKKKGLILANSVGIIDSDYCGENDEVMACFVNISDEDSKIEIGERIAQIIQVKIHESRDVEDFEPTSNNRGGFGSTDKKKGHNTLSGQEYKVLRVEEKPTPKPELD